MSDINDKDIIIIGGGLTGLTLAHYLKKAGKRVLIVDKLNYPGGSIRTFRENGYVFESGPNTGSLSSPEIVELFEELKGCAMQPAKKEAHCRLILKDGRLQPLPSGMLSGLFTNLFTWKDKFGILLEPFRKKGTDPDESIAAFAVRRLGRSYLDYAVDPFISGIYAGDPWSLTTRDALPKLYALEQNYDSCVKGAIAKAKIPKTEREKKATKEVFSVEGGMDNLIQSLVTSIGEENILLGNQSLEISKNGDRWSVKLDGGTFVVPMVISTAGSYALPKLFSFAPVDLMSKINNLRYAPVIQVAIGLPALSGVNFKAFGALIPAREKRNVLGVLYPSSCFDGRAPEGKVTLSVFLGGIRRQDLLLLSDQELEKLVLEELEFIFKKPIKPELIRVFKHSHAIPQYEKNTGERLHAIDEFQKMYPGIILAGNIRDGISMSDRVKQAVNVYNKALSLFSNTLF